MDYRARSRSLKVVVGSIFCLFVLSGITESGVNIGTADAFSAYAIRASNLLEWEPAGTTPDIISERDIFEVQANVFTASEQGNVSLVTDQAGNINVIWDSRRQQRGSYGVYARRFDPIGRPLTNEVQINLYTKNMQCDAAIAQNDLNKMVAVWNSFGQDGDGWGVIARWFDGNLKPLSTEIGVNTTRTGDQFAPVVALAESGQALVVWSSKLRHSKTRIIGRLLGQSNSPEFQIGSPQVDESDGMATISALSHPEGIGSYLVVWTRTDADGDSVGIFAQVINRNGSSGSQEFRVSEVDGRQHIEPAVDSDGRGNCAIAWMSSDNSDYDVRVRWFDKSMQPIGPSAVVLDRKPGHKSGACVALSPAGNTLVSYNRYSDIDDQDDVCAVVYNGAQQRMTPPFRVNRSAPGRQQLDIADGASRIVWSKQDQLIFAWQGQGATGDRSGAYLTLFVPHSLPQQLPLQAALPTGFRPRIEENPAMPHIPPVYDPLWKPQQPLKGISGDGPDFGFEAVPGTGWTPPDPEIAVGINHIVVIVNGQIAFFQKDGLNLFRDEIEDSYGFWGSLGTDNFVFDPEVHYDPHVNRFWAMANERSDNNKSMFLLAVSDDGDPTGNWLKWRLDVTALAGNDIDSPNMAFDENAVYLTADFFSPDTYLIYMLDKSQLLNNGTLTPTSLLITGQQSIGLPVTYDSGVPAQYMIESTENYSTPNTIVRFHAIRTPLTSPTRVTYDLNVEPYKYPVQPPQKGTSSRPYLFEPRFWSCLYRNGSLWAVHHICRVGESRTIVRWYQFAMNDWPQIGSYPTMVQWGEVDPGSSIHCYFPSIFADTSGNAAITFARSSTQEYISMWRVLRRYTDPAGEFRAQVIVKESTSPYVSSRWGDYSGTQSDPADPTVFWGHHEWTDTSSNWRTWVGKYENYFDQVIPTLPPSGFVILLLSLSGLLVWSFRAKTKPQ